MNDIKRLRLQNQIFRHVVTYYQKMGGVQSTKKTLENEAGPAGAVAQNPFAALDPVLFTEQVTDYCTFTRCELSSDGSHAKIFVSIWGNSREQERIFKDIKRHARGMRSSIAKHIRMRVIPQLAFVQDQSFERGAQVDSLIQ